MRLLTLNSLCNDANQMRRINIYLPSKMNVRQGKPSQLSAQPNSEHFRIPQQLQPPLASSCGRKGSDYFVSANPRGTDHATHARRI